MMYHSRTVIKGKRSKETMIIQEKIINSSHGNFLPNAFHAFNSISSTFALALGVCRTIRICYSVLTMAVSLGLTMHTMPFGYIQVILCI